MGGEDERIYHFTLTMIDCKRINLALRMLAKAAYESGDIPAMDSVNSLSARFLPRTLKEQDERIMAGLG